MKKLLTTLLVVLTSALTGCATMTQDHESNAVARPQTLYQARIVDPETGAALSVEALARQLAQTDVVVIGEYHGHQAAHLLQSRLQVRLYEQQPRQVLSMEQFSLDHQAAVDAYLRGETGETELIEDSHAWDNYRASYRPLVEFARQHSLPVIAANAPADIVRCVGRVGPEYIDTLAASERAQLPEQPFTDTPAYREKFDMAVSETHGAADTARGKRLDNTYRAQLLRDNTMASRILTAREKYPGHQIIHTTGTFHSEERLGTVALLQQRAPHLSIAVISPVVWEPGSAKAPLQENRSKGDFLYFIQPLPERFLDKERQRKAMSARFQHSSVTSCGDIQ